MSSSSARGQTEPIAALLAVLVVGAGLALYADVLHGTLDREPERHVAAATLERVEAHLAIDGVVDPTRLAAIDAATPGGYTTNVSLVADDRRWTSGPTTVVDADRASRTVSVRTAPATIERGRLEVVVWT